MLRIALLSDTHGFLDPDIFKYLEPCDEIWHAGDIGTLDVCEKLKAIKPLRAVYGNIDGQEIRKEYPKNLHFQAEGVNVFITHIGGFPGKYVPEARLLIEQERPQLFICGHSHILRIMYDKKHNLLHVNPGAAGIHGFHQVKTLVRFSLHQGDIQNMEVVELGKR
jgi:putative phosphoesterase